MKHGFSRIRELPNETMRSTRRFKVPVPLARKRPGTLVTRPSNFLRNEAIAPRAGFKVQVAEITKRTQSTEYGQKETGHGWDAEQTPIMRIAKRSQLPFRAPSGYIGMSAGIRGKVILRNEPISKPGFVATDETRIFTDKNLRNEANFNWGDELHESPSV